MHDRRVGVVGVVGIVVDVDVGIYINVYGVGVM